MSRFIEGRENFLWSLAGFKADEYIIVRSERSGQLSRGYGHPDTIMLSRKDWEIFKECIHEYWHEGEVNFTEHPVDEARSLSEQFDGDRSEQFFTPMATLLYGKLMKKYDALMGPSYTGREVPMKYQEDIRRVRYNHVLNAVNRLIKFRRIWNCAEREMEARDRYENNIEAYDPDIKNLPADLSVLVKQYLIPSSELSAKLYSKNVSNRSNISHESRQREIPYWRWEDSIKSNNGRNRVRMETSNREDWDINEERGSGSFGNIGHRRHFHNEIRQIIS